MTNSLDSLNWQELRSLKPEDKQKTIEDLNRLWPLIEKFLEQEKTVEELDILTSIPIGTSGFFSRLSVSRDGNIRIWGWNKNTGTKLFLYAKRTASL